MKYSIALICLLMSSILSAQQLDIEFGKFSEEELNMTEYARDKDAAAVVLSDIGKSKFVERDEQNFTIEFTKHKRTKIFTRAGFENNVVAIPFYTDKYGKAEIISSIEAVTYDVVDGKIIGSRKLDPSTIYEEKVTELWKVKKFVFPNVKEGSILEYKYTLETPYFFNLPDWTFQEKIPVIHSEYEVRMIPFFEYIYIAQGLNGFDYQNSKIDMKRRHWGQVNEALGKNYGSGVEYQDYIHVYILKDVPAFKNENYISSIKDYIMEIDFQLAKYYSTDGGTTDIRSSWEELNEDLLKHSDFGKFIKGCSKEYKQLVSVHPKLEKLDQKARSEKIIEYVKNSFTWNGYNTKYAEQKSNNFLKSRSGNSAELNLLLISMLEESGIETYPVILSTRSHGKIQTDYPFNHFTNYVVALVKAGDYTFLADATNMQLPYNRLPIKCLNEKGLIVQKKSEPQWVGLDMGVPSIRKYNITAELDTSNISFKLNTSYQMTEYEAFNKRNIYKNKTDKIKEAYSSNLGNIDNVNAFYYDQISQPYAINFSSNKKLEHVENNIIFNPFFDLPITENLLTEKKRTYPVDFVYPISTSFQFNLTVPENYALTNDLKVYNISNELADIDFNFSYDNNLLVINGHYNFKNSQYSSSEYSRIKYYIDRIVDVFNQDFVLTKK